MATFGIHVDSVAVVAQTNRLEKMSKGALNKAVRNTINRAAFDVKGRSMPAEVKKDFVQRNKTFFKATSKVEPAKGNDINSMVAVVGFVKPAKDPGHAVEDLKQQEEGGTIGNRSFIPLKGARSGGNWNRPVKQGYRLADIMGRQSVQTRSSIVDALENRTGDTNKEKWALSAIAAGKGGFVIGTERMKGARMLLRINSVKRLKKQIKTKAGKVYHGGDTVINATAIYSVRAKRKVGIKATEFMQDASLKSAARMEQFFIEESKKILK